MGYRVDYEPVNMAFRMHSRKGLRLPFLSAAFFVVFLLLVRIFWVSGADALQCLLFPGHWQEAGEALDALLMNLEAGSPFGQCVKAFCREIIREAGLGLG